jgi:hypothetical protein
VIYAYAIVEGRPKLGEETAAGLAGAPLRCVAHGALAAVYSDDPPAAPAPTEDALWEHERVAERLMSEHAVLPLRFGSTLAGVGELRDVLAGRADELTAALVRVRGAVELGVRASVGGVQPGPVRGGTGRAYLAAKLDRRRAAAAIGEALHARLDPLARAASFKTSADPRPAFAGSYLVDRDGVDRFREEAEAAGSAYPELELACTGPWPPFSFTEAA